MTEFPIEPLPDMPMIVVTNRDGLYGANALLDKELMGSISGEAFYILPSSVHELIAIPIKAAESVGDLRELVKAVNESNVPLEERLLESVYLFDGEVRIA